MYSSNFLQATWGEGYTEIFSLTILLIGYLALFGIAELLFHSFQWKVEHTRKFTHISCGFLSLSLPFLFDSHWYVLGLVFLMISVLLIAKKTGILKSIHQIERRSIGDILYPIPFYLCFLVAKWQGDPIYFVLPVLVLVFSDSLAALVGKSLKWRPYTIGKCKKTLGGTFAFAASTLIFSFCSLYFFLPNLSVEMIILHAGTMAFVVSLVEAVSPLGLDNLTVPLFTLLLLFFI